MTSQLFDPLPFKIRIFKPSYVWQSFEGRLYYHDSSCAGTTALVPRRLIKLPSCLGPGTPYVWDTMLCHIFFATCSSSQRLASCLHNNNYYYLVWPSESILRISEMHVKLPSIAKEYFSELSTACDPCGFHASTPTFASVGWLEFKCFTSNELVALTLMCVRGLSQLLQLAHVACGMSIMSEHKLPYLPECK